MQKVEMFFTKAGRLTTIKLTLEKTADCIGFGVGIAKDDEKYDTVYSLSILFIVFDITLYFVRRKTLDDRMKEMEKNKCKN